MQEPITVERIGPQVGPAPDGNGYALNHPEEFVITNDMGSLSLTPHQAQVLLQELGRLTREP